MIDLRAKIPSYCNLTSYDFVFNGLKEFLVQKDITLLSLWAVFLIVFTLSSIIILFKRKHDEVFTFPEARILPPLVQKYVDNPDCGRGDRSIVVNYKHLLTQLHYVTSKCNDSRYASKCIRLVRDCPYLVNVSLEPTGLTPFQRVCYNGHTCLVEYMLAKGANPWLTTQSGENALCLAVYYHIKHPGNKDLSCLDILFDSGCTFDPKSRLFEVILKMATQGCHKRLTEWILVHANVAATDQRSMSVPLAFKNIEGYSQYKPLPRR